MEMIGGTCLQPKEIRVLMDSQAFDLQDYGGISRCFAELINHMPESVNLCLPIVESRNIYLRKIGRASDKDSYMEFCNGHPTVLKRFWYKLTTNIRNGQWSRWDRMPQISLLEAERQLVQGEYDVFHPTYYNPYFLRKIGHKPFVLTVHDMIAELYSKKYKFKDGQLDGKRKLIPLASHIIAVSEHTKQDIIKLYDINPEKISVIYHGADQIPYVPISEKNIYGRYLLYVGGRGKYKNFLCFVRAIAPVLKVHSDLLVICTGKPFSHEELHELQKSGFKNRYIQKFIESDQELLTLYHFAQAFVFPSEYEGFGIPILEAYKAGCPVVLNSSSCFPEIAGNAAVYFGFDKNERSLQESIEELLAWTPVQREDVIRDQRKRLQRYNWEKASRELADVYRKVAGSG